MYSKKISKRCEYCRFAKKIPNKNMVLCEYKGIVSENSHCRKYKYNIFARPVKRIRGFRENNFNKEDFSL